MGVYVQLLGTAKVNLESHSVLFVWDKRYLLLAFLAFKNDWVSRDQLANLFWSDTDSVSARKNLRHLLSRTRGLDFATLEGQDDVRWLVQTDVALFQQHLGAGDWAQAVAVYQGNLLSGLSIESLEFEDWLQQESEILQTAYREAALNYAKQLEAEGHFDEAGVLLAKVLKTDLLAEDIVQAYLRVASQTGHRLEALKVFESFKSMLSLELGLMPLETTLQLAANLRLESQVVNQQPAHVLQNFPSETSSFVGRDLDLSEIAAYFEQPEIRLLTLIGAGGMGKTRLAIQVALEQAKRFSDGATFVPLASVGAASDLVPAIVSALKLSVSSFEAQELQLKNYLSQRHLLLVLDNFEHLLDGAEIVLELLRHCPNLRMVVTTREALNLQCEYLIDVIGLDVPKDASENIEVFDSVQLLLRSAKRVNPRFMLSPEDKPFVIEICQMLQGSPLAIELASNWLRVLSVPEVAAEIRKSLDFLSLNQPELATRHRSIRAVFDSSWVRLPEEQKLALSKLSLLRGGFTVESAARVANATPSLLLGLVSKSLIGRFETRFVMHETVRQYAVQKLEPDQKEAALLELSKLCEKWALAFATHDPEKPGSETAEQFELEFENTSVALEWAAQTKPQLAAQIVYSALEYWFSAAKKPLAIAWSNRLLELPELRGRDSIRANLLSARSFIGYRILNPDLRLSDAHQALEIALEIGDFAAQAKALHAVGEASGDIGDYDTAISSIQKALKILEDLPNAKLETACLNQLAYAYWLHDDIDLACQAYENLIHKSLMTNNKRGLANGYFNSSYIYISLNN